MLGLDIVVCTTAKTDNEARALLRAFNSRSGSDSQAAQTRKTGGRNGKEERC